jgi:hypothetical protein
MKRKTKNHKRKPKRQSKASPVPELQTDGTPDAPSRRGFLRKLRNGGIAALVVGGGGWFVVRDVQATMREHDLSRLGNGMPTVVQIHDPDCPRCVALQREARNAICEVGEANVQFLVANIRTPKGRALAHAHGVGNVTLLLFDGRGKRQGILAGSRHREELANSFRGLMPLVRKKKGA